MIEKILKEIAGDEDMAKAKNLAQRRLEGKTLDIKQQEKLAEEYVRLYGIVSDYANRRGPYAGM